VDADTHYADQKERRREEYQIAHLWPMVASKMSQPKRPGRHGGQAQTHGAPSAQRLATASHAPQSLPFKRAEKQALLHV
jgi:hypothetical protein